MTREGITKMLPEIIFMALALLLIIAMTVAKIDPLLVVLVGLIGGFAFGFVVYPRLRRRWRPQ